MEYQKHLYMIIYPINALVASQLNPADFGQHYSGSSRHQKGKVIFAELDINFRDPFFIIDEKLAETVAYPDGRPKRTKFIASYAVLEHVDFNAILSLYLVTSNGRVLKLNKKEYTAVNQPGLIRLYQEICPLENMVASTFDQREFGNFITNVSKSKGAPKIVFTQIDFNIEEFYEMNKGKEILTSKIPDLNPYMLKEAFTELTKIPDKKIKTVSLASILREIPFTFVRHGYWFFDKKDMFFFAMPDETELETKHFDWWKFASR